MNPFPDSKAPTDPPHNPPARPASDSPLPYPSPLPAATGSGQGGPRALPAHAPRRRRWLLPVAAVGGLLTVAGLVAAYTLTRPAAARADVLTHTVRRGPLNVTVTEKGTVESAMNMDLICKVKAGAKGFATTINWVIEDGASVVPGQLVMVLDDSALQDQFRAQKITADTAYAAKVKAEKDYDIQIQENARLISEAENVLLVASIDLEKFVGLAADPALAALAAVAGAPAMLAEGGDYRRQVDDATGKVRLAESDVEAYRERSAWADRMVKMKYLSPAQAQSERAKLQSSLESLRSLQSVRTLLLDYDRKKLLADFRSKVDNAGRLVAQKELEADAKRVQADIERKTKISIYRQETEKLKEVEDQIQECKIYAPQKGMVVYFRNESNRFGGTPQNLIEQGSQVKEGQKLLRIPNLDVMQVNTKVHEAMVSRIKGDVRVSTGLIDQMRTAMLANPDPFGRLVSQHEDFVNELRTLYRTKEYHTTRKGQSAAVRVDALPDQEFPGRVKLVAGVASQADAMMSDVKLYQTLVLIEKRSPGLKPDMTAEVRINVEGIADALTTPLQAVIGGAELGAKRQVFVRTPTGYAEREITLGLYNEKVVEVRDGLADGDEVVTNPKVLLGDSKSKTRDAGPDGRPASPDGGKAAPADDKKGGDPGKKRKGGGGPPAGPGA